MRKLGLDLGTKSLGFAITDELSIIATGLENFKFSENDFDAAIERIDFYLNKYDIDSIILGYPLRMTGTKSERTLMVEDFKIKLERKFNVKIILQDERLTTKKANEILKMGNLGIKRRKEKKDMMSAILILQSYLN